MATTNTSLTTAPSGTSNQQTLSEWAGPYVTNMMGQAQAVAAQPYQTYQGPMTADTSGLQNKVFQGLGNLAFPSNLGQSFSSEGAYQLPSATGGAPTGTGSGAGIAANYMNPYLNAVLTPQLQEMRRQSDITGMGNDAKATQAGAFGGARQGIMGAENQRNLSNNINTAIGTGYANAYDKGMGQFNVEQGQQKTLADMMSQAGATERGINQEGVTADYNEFLKQRDYPKEQTQYLQSMLQGLPLSTVSNIPQAQTSVQSAVGGVSSLAALLQQLGIIT